MDEQGRTKAYSELFEGDAPILTAEELQLLDALDSALERQGGNGVWGLTSTVFTPLVPQVQTPHSG